MLPALTIKEQHNYPEKSNAPCLTIKEQHTYPPLVHVFLFPQASLSNQQQFTEALMLHAPINPSCPGLKLRPACKVGSPLMLTNRPF